MHYTTGKLSAVQISAVQCSAVQYNVVKPQGARHLGPYFLPINGNLLHNNRNFSKWPNWWMEDWKRRENSQEGIYEITNNPKNNIVSLFLESQFMYVFSLHRPTGPIQSLSRNVRLLSCVVCHQIQFSFWRSSSVGQSILKWFSTVVKQFQRFSTIFNLFQTGLTGF